MKKALVMSLMAIVLTAMSVRAYNVKGVVVDSIGEPESFATIRVYSPVDSIKPVALGTADVDGLFDITIKQTGKYRVNINSVGKQPINENISVSTSAPTADLGRLVSRVSSTALKEVTVTANRPLVIKEIDRIGYDVQADEDAKTVQLDEMLRRVPMVSVDPDGTIRVKGSTSFKVYKNGRPNNSFSRNAKDIFKAIPASMIKKIEVITDPGAREDAEGSSAILNIVTMENTVIAGVMGTAGLDWSNASAIPNVNLWLTGQVNKVNVSAYGGYSHLSKYNSESEADSYERFDATGNTRRNQSHSSGDGDITWFGLDGSWEPDTLNLFTAEFNGYYYNFNNHQDAFTSTTDGAGNVLSSYRSSLLPGSNMSYFDLNGSVNYQHSTHRKGETITLSYMISTTNQTQDSRTRYSDIIGSPLGYTGIDNNFKLNFVEHTGQIDWEHPFAAHHKMNLGGKYIYRQNHSKTNIDYIDSELFTRSNFIHRTQVGAGYFDYRFGSGPWGARAGLRYEFSRLSAKYRDGSQEPFGSNLNDLVPNVSVSYNINDFNTLKIGFSDRISRPGISYLNPAVNETPTTVSQGNPDLGSTHVRDINLNYSYMTMKVNLDFTASYGFSDNAIIDVNNIVNDITYSTYANEGRNRLLYMSLFARWNINTKANISFNGSMNWENQRNRSLGIENKGWSGWLSMRYSQKLPWNLQLNAGVFSFLGSSNLYSEFRPMGANYFNHNLSLQRSFLKEDRLTVRLSAQNPFGPSRRKFRSRQLNMPMTGETVTTMRHNQNVGISISYRFGSVSSQVKKAANAINNDDLQGRKNE